MAENEANFREVLDVEVNVPKFVDGLNKLTQAYQQWKANTADSGSILGASVTDGLRRELRSLSELLESLTRDVSESLANITSVVEGTVERSTTKSEARLRAVKKLAEDIEIEQEGLRNKFVDQQDASVEKLAASRKSLFDEDIKRAEALYQAEQKRGSLEEQLATARRNILNAEMQAAAESAKEQERVLRQQLAADKQRDKLARDIDIEQEGVVNKSEAERTKFLEKQVAAAREKLNLELKAAEARAKEEAALERENAKLDERNRKLSREIEIEQEGVQNRAAEEDLKRQREQEHLQQQFNTALRETDRLTGKVASSAATTVGDKLNALRRALAEVRRESAQLQASLSNRTGGPTKDSVAEQNRLNQLLREEASLLNNINNITKSNEGLLTRIVGHWRQSLAHLVRFYLLWQGLQAVVNAFTAAIAAPFKLIADGVRYLQNLETQTSDLTGVLLASGKFSEDVAKNFTLAREAAKDLTELLEEASIASNIPAEQLEKTFRALLTGGAAQAVGGNLKDLVSLAQVFQQTLTAAGIGALAAQGSIEEITKLFLGTSESTNKFLRGLKLSREEWEKIRKEGMAHGDLLDRLRDRFAPYLRAVEGARFDQERLIKQVTLLKDRIAALASEDLFRGLTDGLKRFGEFLDQNREKLAAFLKVLTDGLYLVGQALQNLLGDVFSEAFIEKMLTLRRIVLETVNAVVAASAITSASSRLDAEEGIKAYVNYNLARMELDRSEKKIRELFGEGRLVNEFGFQRSRREIPAYQPGKAEPLEESNRRVVTSGFEEEKQQYLSAQEDIQEASKRTRQQIDLDLADRAITQETATKRIAASINSEMNALVALDKVFEEQISKTRRDLAAEKDPKEREAALNRFGAQVEAFRRSQQKRNQQLLDELNRAERAALRERVNAETASFEERNKALEQSIENRKKLLSAAREAEILTEVQYFEKVADLDDESYKIKQDLLYARLKDVQNSATESIKIEGEIMRLESEHNAQQRVYSQQYQTLKEQETLKIAEQAAQLREISNQSLETYLRLTQLLSPEQGYGKAIKDIISLRSQELDALEATTRRHLEIAQAKNMESDETRRLTVELRQLGAQRAELFSQQIQEIVNGTTGTTARNLLVRNASIAQGRTLNQRVQDARDRLASFDEANPDAAQFKDLSAQRKALEEEFKAASEASRDFADTLRDQVIPSWQRAFRSVTDILLGSGFKEAWAQATTGMEKAGVASEAAANALANIQGLINTYRQGSEQGGVLGGIGAVTSQLAPALSAIPVVGQFLPAIGGALSFIGGLFTAAAKRIGEDIKKSFSQTLEEYQAGNKTLVETLQSLEQQRMSAISRLSGRKGGQDQLNQLLPEFDREIQRLRDQQQEIVESFDTALNNLRLQSDVLEQVYGQWASINEQVKEYVGAGGDAAKAAEFLSLQLGKIREETLRDLEQAEQDAIQEAIALNDLLEERNKLVEDFRKKEFDLINQNSIERRQAGSVARGRELQELRTQQQQALDNLDQQIRLSTIKVDKEREVFQFSTDIAALHRRDEELTLKFLDAQIQKYRDMKTLIESIVLGPNGFTANLLTPSPTPVISIGNIYLSGYPDPAQAGREFYDGVADEYYRRERMVLA
jgi:hypothetical protein